MGMAAHEQGYAILDPHTRRMSIGDTVSSMMPMGIPSNNTDCSYGTVSNGTTYKAA
jgi:hypothetical protein